MNSAQWPPLPYETWSATHDTLHAHAQILGKLAVALAPPEPQLQHAASHATARGWETRPLPAPDHSGSLVVALDLHRHHAVAEHSDGRHTPSRSAPDRPVADVTHELLASDDLVGAVSINTTPQDGVDDAPRRRLRARHLATRSGRRVLRRRDPGRPRARRDPRPLSRPLHTRQRLVGHLRPRGQPLLGTIGRPALAGLHHAQLRERRADRDRLVAGRRSSSTRSLLRIAPASDADSSTALCARSAAHWTRSSASTSSTGTTPDKNPISRRRRAVRALSDPTRLHRVQLGPRSRCERRRHPAADHLGHRRPDHRSTTRSLTRNTDRNGASPVAVDMVASRPTAAHGRVGTSQELAITRPRTRSAQAGAELLADAGGVVRVLGVDRAEDDPLGAGVAVAGQRLRDEARAAHDGAGPGVRAARPWPRAASSSWSRTTSPPQLVVNESGSGLSRRTSDATSAASTANASGSRPQRFQPFALSAATSPTWRARPPTQAGYGRSAISRSDARSRFTRSCSVPIGRPNVSISGPARPRRPHRPRR